MARKHQAAATIDPFIVATGRDAIKPGGQTRKLIRSHVMKGKNKGEGKRKGIKTCSTQRSPATGDGVVVVRTDSTTPDSERASSALTPPPGRILSASQTEPRSLPITRIIHEFMAVMKRAMYPIERYVGVGTDEAGWFNEATMRRDAAYTHIVAYSAQAFFDTARRGATAGPVSQRALIHTSRGIRLLRKRVSMLDFACTDATIFLVLALGMFSEAHGELEPAQMHLGGLYQLVQLRGGIRALSNRRFLQIKCCRLDLALALRTGSQPLFFAGEDESLFSRARLLGSSEATAFAMPLPFIADTTCEADMRLIDIWQDLRAFTTAVNFARQTGTKIAPELFQEALISVHYRLHRLAPSDKFAHGGGGHDALRLSMLSFSTTFFLEVHSHNFQYLAAQLQISLQARHIKQARSSHESLAASPRLQELDLWMIFVAASSSLSGPQYRLWLQDELRKKLSKLRLTAWDAVEAILNRFLWVGSLHNAPARAFFESAAT